MGIDLRFAPISDHNRSRFNYAEKIETFLLSHQPTDYLVAPFLSGSETKLLALVNKHKINFISYNSPITNDIQKQTGLPRTPNKYWLAHVSPDDEQVGYDMAKQLYQSHHKADRKLKLVAVNGGKQSEVAKQRAKGLYRYLAENNDVDLLQMIHTGWSPDHAKTLAKQMFTRFNHYDAIWAASDALAIATYHTIPDEQRAQQVDIVSIDWTKEVASLIEDNKVLASYGGHVLEGIWILILIKDHFHGIDFYFNPTDQHIHQGNGIINYQLAAIKRDKVDLLSNIKQLKPNLASLSKCLSGQNKAYQFDIKALLTQH